MNPTPLALTDPHQNLIIKEFQNQSAQSVADFFLSPYVDEALFQNLTAEEGPSLWIVNRSDVYNENLDMLSRHAVAGIRDRAIQKKTQRSGLSLNVLPDPKVFDESQAVGMGLDEIEEVLGHPLADFRAMLFFSENSLEDARASACLSLTRRLLEYPPTWIAHDHLLTEIQSQFGKLLIQDPSPFVRSFAARIPLLTETQISEALKTETHPFILGRLLQNPSFKGACFERFLKELFENPASFERFFQNEDFLFPSFVFLLDRRLSSESVAEIQKRGGARNPLAQALLNSRLKN
jgi:hypothetical protein